MSILVINSGSSSLKIKIFSDIDTPAIVHGNLEKIGEEHSALHCQFAQNKIDKQITCADHREGLEQFFTVLKDNNALVDITAIGHRVVHGGEDFSQPVKIDDNVIATIEKNIPLAPLHNPANLKGIEATMYMFPDVPQVAVFDTAFHQSVPEHAYRYAVPESFYKEQKIRSYGFHGSSHQYVSKEAARILQKPTEQTNLITLHLGNGASVAAIKNGKSIDTSMGMTPLEGLIMGTRCGDIDPGVLLFLLQKYSHDELDKILNKKSGLLGLCGSNDMRDIEAQNTEQSRLTIKMVVHRIQKYIGSFYAQLPELDAVVFTAGIGENSKLIRKLCCENLAHLGIELCDEKNNNVTCGEIQSSQSKVKILVIPTNEEMEIARQTYTLINV
ncbi:acetate/propionate family kinase [Candidatus Uabimicrobium amorphum]|uniref:Acetate kinase n=1 Tax=Uabimicrobium amorphum TaxID=2596890 RepID=A0A5S9IQ20_UABAM|nr:acetate kinase [Candidatus Uabimicrobium amorphum]BBM85050.1 acetate kinase [Candidatus Uabimicrobium amorphum]